jgi:hypothetical protein
VVWFFSQPSTFATAIHRASSEHRPSSSPDHPTL